MRSLIILPGLLVLVFASCAKRSTTVPAPPAATPQDNSKLTVISYAFKEGETIPRQFTCDGINISPPLEWGKAPAPAKTIAIVAEDPDAPGGTWAHWVAYNLSAENIGMVENLPATEKLIAGGFHGKNDFGNLGYGGPCPPSGTHRYVFKVYALDVELPLKPGATKGEVESAMQGHIVAQGEIMGRYKR